MKTVLQRVAMTFAILALVPTFGASNGGGCGNSDNPFLSNSPAPDVGGDWDIMYDDELDVEIRIGGAVYERTIGAGGGVITIDHNGDPFEFNLACERPEVVCPSEVWPATVALSQREPNFPHRMFASLPNQTCVGEVRPPPIDSCGPGTPNEDCDDVCQGEVRTTVQDRFGLINNAGTKFDLLLGAGAASNGVNCLLLGLSVAKAELTTVGNASTGDWEAIQMTNGEVITGYAGGCLWAGDPDDDGRLEALVLGASVKFTTGFQGQKR